MLEPSVFFVPGQQKVNVLSVVGLTKNRLRQKCEEAKVVFVVSLVVPVVVGFLADFGGH
jgi:hypothetical protein